MIYHAFCYLDLDHMTFMYDLDMTILKMYLHTENELFGTRLSNVRVLQTDRRRPNVLLQPHAFAGVI